MATAPPPEHHFEVCLTIPCEAGWGESAVAAVEKLRDEPEMGPEIATTDLKLRGDDLFDLVLTWSEVWATNAPAAATFCLVFVRGILPERIVEADTMSLTVALKRHL